MSKWIQKPVYEILIYSTTSALIYVCVPVVVKSNDVTNEWNSGDMGGSMMRILKLPIYSLRIKKN